MLGARWKIILQYGDLIAKINWHRLVLIVRGTFPGVFTGVADSQGDFAFWPRVSGPANYHPI